MTKPSFFSRQKGVCLFSVLMIGLLASRAESIVLHPAGEPQPGWTDHPEAAVIGRWNSVATCIALSPNHILSVRHAEPGGDLETFRKNVRAIINGITYKADILYVIPEMANVDLRLIKLKNADLTVFAPPYSDTDEKYKTVVMGGTGHSRGEVCYDGQGRPYAYDWDYSSPQTVRFGTNKINSTLSNNYVAGYIEDLLLIDFDALGVGDPTAYEASMADHDSGSGWFINKNGTWYLAGMGAYVDQVGRSQFARSDNATVADPDNNYGVRISSYTPYIQVVLNQECTENKKADMNDDCVVNLVDLEILAQYWLRSDCGPANNYCDGADLNKDSRVDIRDKAVFNHEWQGDGDN